NRRQKQTNRVKDNGGFLHCRVCDVARHHRRGKGNEGNAHEIQPVEQGEIVVAARVELEDVVMLIQWMPIMTKLNTYPKSDGHKPNNAKARSREFPPSKCGTLISKMSSVIAIANTPSLNHSMRWVVTSVSALGVGHIFAQ